jgi:hypothetical protein
MKELIHNDESFQLVGFCMEIDLERTRTSHLSLKSFRRFPIREIRDIRVKPDFQNA